jgi:preprotein translocase subunit SecB
MAEQPPQAQAPLTVNAQYVKTLDFKNPGAPKTLVNMKEAPQVNIAVDVKAQKFNEELYEVILAIRADAKTGVEPVFVVDLAYAGLFTVKMPAAQIQPVLLVECPRLLFPFARALIADITRDGGFAPLMVHPIDFAGLYRQQQQSPQAAAGGKPNA